MSRAETAAFLQPFEVAQEKATSSKSKPNLGRCYSLVFPGQWSRQRQDDLRRKRVIVAGTEQTEKEELGYKTIRSGGGKQVPIALLLLLAWLFFCLRCRGSRTKDMSFT